MRDGRCGRRRTYDVRAYMASTYGAFPSVHFPCCLLPLLPPNFCFQPSVRHRSTITSTKWPPLRSDQAYRQTLPVVRCWLPERDRAARSADSEFPPCSIRGVPERTNAGPVADSLTAIPMAGRIRPSRQDGPTEGLASNCPTSVEYRPFTQSNDRHCILLPNNDRFLPHSKEACTNGHKPTTPSFRPFFA
jgi:hypothetical protein